MGPRSDNRGYGLGRTNTALFIQELQWVHGPITVVMLASTGTGRCRPLASMGPRSDNRGYGRPLLLPEAGSGCFNGSTVR